jgi:predicted aconitase
MLLKWRQDGELHFAHTDYGMYMIEQRRGEFIMSLTLKGAGEQDLGTVGKLVKAKSEIAKTHKALAKLER